MTDATDPAPRPTTDGAVTDRRAVYEELHASEEFQRLRRRYLGFVVPWTITFLSWYMLYVLCSNWATDFMSTEVIGNVNVGLIFGVLQFVSTFLIAWLYSRHANTQLDPLANRIEAEYARETGGMGVGR